MYQQHAIQPKKVNECLIDELKKRNLWGAIAQNATTEELAGIMYGNGDITKALSIIEKIELRAIERGDLNLGVAINQALIDGDFHTNSKRKKGYIILKREYNKPLFRGEFKQSILFEHDPFFNTIEDAEFNLQALIAKLNFPTSNSIMFEIVKSYNEPIFPISPYCSRYVIDGIRNKCWVNKQTNTDKYLENEILRLNMFQAIQQWEERKKG